MARKTFQELEAELTAIFPDNNQGEITPDRFWTFFTDIFHTLRPATGLLSRITQAVQNVTTVYAPMVFDSVILSTVPDFSGNAAQGKVIRLQPGVSRLTLTGVCQGSSNRYVDINIVKNGVSIPSLATRINLTGTGNPVSFTLTGLDTSTVNLTEYQAQVKCETNTPITFSNLYYLAEVVPA